MFRFAWLAILLFLVSLPAPAANPLVRLENCTLIRTDWADGDSFLVRTADGVEHTLRLYGADCIEWHVTDNTDARRLWAQRRFFGISEAGGSPPASITAAKEFGRLAALKTTELLEQPFTIHTAFADARGDGKHKRIYGFVTTAGGRDLASELVSLGLARAFGVYRETPDHKHFDEYREALRDRELQAAKRGTGVWALTDWDKLPAERRQQRDEEAELDLAKGRKATLAEASIDPNTAARDELMTLPGIGEVMANRIIENRPYSSPEDLSRVSGIGETTLKRLRPFLKWTTGPKPR